MAVRNVAAILAVAAALPAAEVASVDALGALTALFYAGETLPVTSNLKVEAGGRTAFLGDSDRTRVERNVEGGIWRGSVNGFQFEQTVQGTRIALTLTAEREMPSARVSFYLTVPRPAFAGGQWNGMTRLTPERPEGEAVFQGALSKFDLARDALRFEAVLDRVRPVRLHDLWLRNGRYYAADVELHRGPVTAGQTIAFETTLGVEGKPDTKPAALLLDASKTRYKFHGFGGNYCFNTDSPVTAYTLKNLRSAWARVEMNSREWEPENDDASAETTNWPVLKARDVDGTKLHRDFLLARQIQDKGIPYAIAVWRLPEWLYSDPNQQPASAHRRKVPAEKWNELLEHIGSYLVHAKEQYGVEPDLFSFNEANIGVYVLFSPEEHRHAIKSIGAHLKKLGLKTRMLLGDATGPRDTHLWALPAANDPEALQYAGAVAFHSWEGGTPAHYAAWGDLAEWLKLPLLVAEVGVDAAAWRNSTYDTFHYGMREVQMYQELLLHARPQGFMQWEYTGDYGLARTVKKSDGTVEVLPTSRLWFLKQFSDWTPQHSDAVETRSDNTKVLFTAFRGTEQERPVVAMHVANLGAGRQVTLRGIPAGVKRLRAVRTSETEDMKALDSVPVAGGEAKLTLPSRCLVSLAGDL